MLSAFSLAVTVRNEKATGDKFSAAFNTASAEEFSQWEARGSGRVFYRSFLGSAPRSYLFVVLRFPRTPINILIPNYCARKVHVGGSKSFPYVTWLEKKKSLK